MSVILTMLGVAAGVVGVVFEIVIEDDRNNNTYGFDYAGCFRISDFVKCFITRNIARFVMLLGVILSIFAVMLA